MSFTPINKKSAHSTNWWTCLRNSANNAWYSNGNNGNFNNNNMYNGYTVLPVSN